MKAIETRYKGYRFRSRLEARWAVFFDALGIEWEYEPEGFELPDGTRYLPDFFLPRFNDKEHGTYVEVKPDDTDFEKSKKFALYTKALVLLLDGVPREKAYYIAPGKVGLEATNCCFYSDYLPGGSHASEYRLFFCLGSPEDASTYAEVRHAVEAARSARFEFGESGALK